MTLDRRQQRANPRLALLHSWLLLYHRPLAGFTLELHEMPERSTRPHRGPDGPCHGFADSVN